MADEELVVKASLKDELSRPLDHTTAVVEELGEALDRSGAQAEKTGRQYWESMNRAQKFGTVLSKTVNVAVKGFLAPGKAAIAVTKSIGEGAVSAGRKLSRNLVSGFKDAIRYGDKFKHQATGGFGLRTLVTGGLITGGIQSLIGYGKQAVTTGLQVAAGMEQSQIAFTTMLGSGRKAKRFMTELAAFAAKTPFDMPGLTTAASSLISAGIDSKKVIPIMTTLGDVTSGMGTGAEGIQRATVALQQMNAAQKISGEDLNQLRDAGIPVYDLLSKATGKSKAEVVKLAQSGKLGKKELGQMMKALTTGKGLERFSGLMDKQSTSLTGLWSTFKDTLGQGLAKAIQPGLPLIKRGLGGAISFVQKGADWLATTVPKIGPAWKKGVAEVQSSPVFKSVLVLGHSVADLFTGRIIPAAVKLWDTFGPKSKGTRESLGDLSTKVRSLAHWITGSLGPAITKATDWLVKNQGSVRGFFAVIGIAIGVLKAFRIVMAAVNLVMAANPIGLVILAIAGLVAGVIYLRKRFDWFRKATDKVFYWLKVAVLSWSLIVVTVFKYLAKAFLKLVSVLIHGAAAAFGWVPGLGPKLKSAAKAVDGFKDAANKSLDKVQNKIQVQIDTTEAKEKAKQLAEQISKYKATILVTAVSAGANNQRRLAASGLGNYGDTRTAHGSGRGPRRLVSTLNAFDRINAQLGGSYRISNALVGGGGRGRGSGDHQAGRALDVVGGDKATFARAVNDGGGFAAVHGVGPQSHVHAVMGDTVTPRSSRMTSGPAAVVPVVNVTLNVQGTSDEVVARIEAKVPGIVSRAVQDAVERS